jgi:hypothetical protein
MVAAFIVSLHLLRKVLFNLATSLVTLEPEFDASFLYLPTP